MRLFSVVLTLAVFAGITEACSPVVRKVAVVKKAAVVEVVEVKRVLALDYVPIAVAVPAYQAGYAAYPQPAIAAPTPAITAPAAVSPDVAALQARIAALERLLAVQGGGNVATPKPADRAPEQIPPLESKAVPGGKLTACAGCHEAAVAEAKGGSKVLLTGGVLTTNRALLHKGMQLTLSGKMPKAPAPPLSEDAKAEVMSALLGEGQ
jgi:hypothetical protein